MPPEETDGQTEGPAEPEAPEASEDSEGTPGNEQDAPVEADPADAASGAEAPEAEVLKEVPAVLQVTGRIMYIPSEPTPAQEMGVDPLDEGMDGPAGKWVLATEEGPMLLVDPAEIAGEAGSGVAVAVAVPVTPEVQSELQSEIDAAAYPTVEAALEKIVAAAEASGIATVVTGEVVSSDVASDTPLTGAPSKSGHIADIVYVGTANKQSLLTNLLKQASAYWKSQSNGAIPKISMGQYAKMGGSACAADALWPAAAKKFGKKPKDYVDGGARHLIVFVESGHCGAAGLGSVGSIHSGGNVWVDLKGNTTNKGPLKVLAHEIGHNLSLGHSQARSCTSGVDTSVSLKGDEQTAKRVYKPNSPCKDIEYRDAWSLMGSGLPGGVPALSTAQKSALGVLPSGSVKTVTAAGGRTQTLKINGAGSASGLRGLKVNTPNGGSFFVEYRNGRGQDAGSQIRPGQQWQFGTSPLFLSTGVQVVKSYSTAQERWRWTNGYNTWYTWENVQYPRSTAIPFRSGNKLHIAGTKGQSTIPFSSNARVRVVSTTSNQATVRVEFTPFIDVPYNHKFGKEINWMSSAKLSTGIKAGGVQRKYAAKANVTREAMAAFLYRLSTPKGAKAPKGYKIPKKSPFRDVSTKHKFYKEIAWMYQSGLSTGIRSSAGRVYAPKAGVTREAMAAFVYRMEKSKYKGAKATPFADIKKGRKFYKEITWMYSSGLSTGVKQKSGKPKYMPKNNVTREAMAAFIYRLKH